MLAAARIDGGFLRRGAVHRARFLRARGGGLHLAKGSKKHVGERAVHGLRHDHGENEPGRAIQRAGDDQEFRVQDESHGRGGESGIGIQQRDHRGHVGAANGHNHHHSENQGDEDNQRKQSLLPGVEHQKHRQQNGNGQQRQVHEVLPAIGDGPLRQDFLQLARGHQAARESERAQDDFEAKHRHLEAAECRAR